MKNRSINLIPKNMNNKIISILIAATALFAACGQDIEGYDKSDAYIYFNVPFVKDQYGRDTKTRVDSIYYSFALEDISVTSAIIKVPVNITGIAKDYDRDYKVEVVTEQTTASDSDWDKSLISATSIKRGEFRDTLFIKVNRTAELRNTWKHITFRILPNDEFATGYDNLLQAKVSFSDILSPPDWWEKWKASFGEYSREKFIKWQEIYYLGADPNLGLYGGPGIGQPLYWNNMPYYVNSSWFPSTFMFIRILKQYFIDNEVYPDGDTSKPRISLP